MSFNQKKKYDIEEQTLQTLGQKLAGIHGELQDYACNTLASQVANIDLMMLFYADDVELTEALKEIRNKLITTGRADYIKKSDILTNLSLLVGRTGAQHRHGTRHESTDISKA
jgi:hypothetical protein